MLRKLGASAVFDHTGPNVMTDIATAMKGKRLAGTLLAPGGAGDCFATIDQCDRARRVAVTLPQPDGQTADVEIVHFSGVRLKDREVGPMIYADYLPRPLAEGRFVASPAPMVVGRGLHAPQEVLKVQKAGVSARRDVVDLSSQPLRKGTRKTWRVPASSSHSHSIVPGGFDVMS